MLSISIFSPSLLEGLSTLTVLREAVDIDGSIEYVTEGSTYEVSEDSLVDARELLGYGGIEGAFLEDE